MACPLPASTICCTICDSPGHSTLTPIVNALKGKDRMVPVLAQGYQVSASVCIPMDPFSTGHSPTGVVSEETEEGT